MESNFYIGFWQIINMLFLTYSMAIVIIYTGMSLVSIFHLFHYKTRNMEKIKVLLVDDDLDFGNTAVLLLKKAGYEVYFQNTLLGVESLIMKLSPNLPV